MEAIGKLRERCLNSGYDSVMVDYLYMVGIFMLYFVDVYPSTLERQRSSTILGLTNISWLPLVLLYLITPKNARWEKVWRILVSSSLKTCTLGENTLFPKENICGMKD